MERLEVFLLSQLCPGLSTSVINASSTLFGIQTK